MKIIFVRHGDPDYARDSITERGEVEARLLNARMKKINPNYCYVSPLGRAKRTAELGLEGMGIEPVEYEWLQEFCVRIKRPDLTERSWVTWDWIPADWVGRDELLDVDNWGNDPIMAEAQAGERYKTVCDEFDKLLAGHGYVRDGRLYRAEKPNMDTLVFFCHFGVTCVLLSHLMNVSPMILWQGVATAPTSVTTVISEERREGTAYFRASAIGDISHLYVADVEPSFSARFCECYKNADERHD